MLISGQLLLLTVPLHLLCLPQFFFLYVDGDISLVGLHSEHKLIFLGSGTFVAGQFESWWPRVRLAVLVPEALHPFLGRFQV